MPKLVPIVNLQDEVIGVKPKRECSPEDITRVSGLFLYNSKREILLSKRVMTKWHDPGKWSFAVAGTVESHETYLENILKETKEEIGLTLKSEDVKVLWYGLFEATHKFFYTQYVTERDAPLNVLKKQVEEVDELRYIPAEEFFAWVEARPEDFVTSMPRVADLVRKALKW